MLCALFGALRPRVPRGLRALTALARSSRFGSYVMAGLGLSTSLTQDLADRRQFRGALCDIDEAYRPG
jgi:hypothetical protein